MPDIVSLCVPADGKTSYYSIIFWRTVLLKTAFTKTGRADIITGGEVFADEIDFSKNI